MLEILSHILGQPIQKAVEEGYDSDGRKSPEMDSAKHTLTLRFTYDYKAYQFLGVMLFTAPCVLLGWLPGEAWNTLWPSLLLFSMAVLTFLSWMEALTTVVTVSRSGIQFTKLGRTPKSILWEAIQVVDFVYKDFVLHEHSGIQTRISLRLQGAQAFAAMLQELMPERLTSKTSEAFAILKVADFVPNKS